MHEFYRILLYFPGVLLFFLSFSNPFLSFFFLTFPLFHNFCLLSSPSSIFHFFWHLLSFFSEPGKQRDIPLSVHQQSQSMIANSGILFLSFNTNARLKKFARILSQNICSQGNIKIKRRKFARTLYYLSIYDNLFVKGEDGFFFMFI